MLGRFRDYWSKVHEDNEWQSEEQIVRPGRGEGVAAGSEGCQENGTGVPYPHLCVGKREGRCEETVTRVPCTTSSAIAFSHRAFNRILSFTEIPETVCYAVMEHVYLVPHVEEADYLFLKTIIPSRKATRDYGRKDKP